MSTDAPPSHTVHAGRLIARRLRANGVDTVFTLSGGHLFSIYDGCREEGIRLIDTRHEQTATFAAEGWSKVTRVPRVAALTAGPGGTNGMSAMAAAQQNQSPLPVLGGRAVPPGRRTPDPGADERDGPRRGARRPSVGLLAGAVKSLGRGRRCRGGRRADGLPAGLRQGVRGADPARRGRSRQTGPRAPAPGCG